MDRQPLGDSGARAKTLDILQRIGEAASAMGDQRADGLAGKIIAFQEGEHGHGHGRPPVGEGDDDGIICFHVFHPRCQFRPGVFIVFPLGDLNLLHVIVGIFPDGVNVEQIAVDRGVNLLRHHLGVTHGQFPNTAMRIVLPRVRKISDQCLCHASNLLKTDWKLAFLIYRLSIKKSWPRNNGRFLEIGGLGNLFGQVVSYFFGHMKLREPALDQ